MKVFIDGKEIEVKNDVKIIWDHFIIDEDWEEEEVMVHLGVNHEGIVIDSVRSDGMIDATMSKDLDDMLELCI